MVALENNGPDTNGSRFVITLAPLTQMEGTYTIFGRVLSGLDLLTALPARNPQPGIYLPPGETVLHVTVEEH
jgi:cyclophilin family peptidyl-prolyl cis-trans isomerase